MAYAMRTEATAGAASAGQNQEQSIKPVLTTAIDIALLAVPFLGEERIIGAGVELFGGLERGRRAVWASNNRSLRFYDCVAATCARSIRGRGRVVTADEVRANANANNLLILRRGGVRERQMHHIFESSGRRVEPVPYGQFGSGVDVAVVYRQPSGNYHMLYMRQPRNNVYYLEDANSGGRLIGTDAMRFMRDNGATMDLYWIK